ncbi:MAG TPA: biopolymer transporter ExbD, partial [Planctomycetaceae bacterium]|nr:biopolymer transporter ExbD [Planctomycetaceae bacterium]
MPLKSMESVEEPHLNLTPMIDVVFLLIIFFMVGTQFSQRERQFDIQLPTVSDAQPLTSRPDDLIVNVLKDGTIIFNRKVVTVEELERQLRAARENYPDQSVIIRGDASGQYQF